MKNTILTFLMAFLVVSATAQELPRPSPMGSTSQIVGVTEVSVDYYRPGVKDRTIFGDLVPYGELWRFGANGCTKFTTADAISFGDQKLPAGTYAMFAIPNENGTWEIIFNTDTEQGGTSDYDAEKDVFRLKAKAQLSSFTETFTLTFDAVKTNSAHFVILWENLRIAIPFEVNTNEFSKRNIDEAIKKGEDLGSVYSSAANFYYGTLEDNATAMEMVDKSLKVKTDYRNSFMKARILEKTGKKMEAIKWATKALDLAKAAEAKGYSNFISNTLADWKK